MTDIVKSDSLDLKQLINEWLIFIDVKPQSAVTYQRAIRQFLVFIKDLPNLPTYNDILLFKQHLILQKKSISTINLYITAVRLFFTFLDFKHIFTLEGIDHIKGLKNTFEHKKDALTAQQSRSLLDSFTSGLFDERNRAIVAIMLTCGLRCVEIARADIEDLQISYDRMVLFVQGKGRDDKSQCVMIPDLVRPLLTEYLAVRPSNLGNSLFVGQRGRLTPSSISHIIKDHLRFIGLDSKRLTAHSLRHTAATSMLLNGVDVLQVQQILRHKNVNTTLIYSHHIDRLKNFGEDFAARFILNT